MDGAFTDSSMATFDSYGAGLPKSLLASRNLLLIMASATKSSMTYSSVASTLHRFNASTNDGHLQNLARGCEGWEISRLHDRSRRRHGCAGCGNSDSSHAGARSGMSMEL